MPARPRGSARGSFRGIPSTVRKLDKRKKVKTPPQPRISSRIGSNPPSRSRSSRPGRNSNSVVTRTPQKRRLSSPPNKSVIRKPREELRPPIEPKRSLDASKNRERTPEKQYVEKLSFDEPSKEHTRPLYTKESIKNLSIRVNHYKEKFTQRTCDPNFILNYTVDPENVIVVRRPGKNEKKIVLLRGLKNPRNKHWSKHRDSPKERGKDLKEKVSDFFTAQLIKSRISH